MLTRSTSVSFVSFFAFLVQARRALPWKSTNTSLPKKRLWKAFTGFKIISFEIFLCTSFQNTFFFFLKIEFSEWWEQMKIGCGERSFCQVVRQMRIKAMEMEAGVIVTWRASVCPSPETHKIFSKQAPCGTWQAKSYYCSSPRKGTCQMETLGLC